MTLKIISKIVVRNLNHVERKVPKYENHKIRERKVMASDAIFACVHKHFLSSD